MAKYTDRDIEELVELIKRKKGGVSILTGAGCSLSAGIPLAATLVEEINKRHSHAISRHIKDEARRGDYGACMGALPIKERKAILEPYLQGARINWAHIALAALMRAGHVRRVLTFNFDSVLARACGLLGVYPATYDFGVSPSERPDYLAEPCIVHLHGQGYGPVMMNTEKETTEHARKIQPLFKDTLEEGPLLVIGYSGEADQVFPVLKETYANKESLYWLGYSDEPKPHLRALLDDHSGCCYFGGADADGVLIALARRLDCFPPQVFADPAAHLLSEIEAVAAFPLDKTSEKIDLLENTKVRLAEHGPRLRLTQGTTSAFQGDAEAILAATDEGGAGAEDGEGSASPELLAWAHFSKGTDLLLSGQEMGDSESLKLAIVELKSAVLLKPDNHEALNNWGNALLGLARLESDEGLYREACEKYAQALTIKPDKHGALNNWGIALQGLAELKNGEALYRETCEKYAQALAIKPDNHEALNNWGNTLLGLARLKSDEDLYGEACEKYTQALVIQPDNHDALNNWGIALQDLAELKGDGGLYREACEKYTQALAIKPDKHEALYNWGNALLALANLKGDEGLYREACEKYAQALAIKPDKHEALYNWGNALLGLAKLKGDEGLYREACEKYAQALAIKPDKHEALNNWGIALRNLAKLKGDEGLYREACEKYAQALVIKPDDDEALSNWGSALLHWWRLSGADELLEKARDVLDRQEALNPSAPYNRACVAALMGDEEGCRTRLLRAKEAGALPLRAHLIADEDLASVRDKSWFKALLEA
jgi:tetratricopeptide (TPR) repeat protein